MSTQSTIALEVKLDGRPVESETICARVGPRALVIATTLPEPELAFELTSAFMGHKGVPTHVAHLTLGPPGHHPVMATDDHEHKNLNPNDRVRECVYEHVGVVLEHLKQLGYAAAIDVPDDAFEQLERVEN
ncbi:MAG TPA: hypothetical protein VES97_04215 [Solirubrobacteraceae bacterium]|nr:hypothetical protein [Solirubrobacteraceae bacterium]